MTSAQRGGSDLQVIGGGPLPHLISLPGAGEASGRGRPLLCFLHGYDEGAPMEIGRALTLRGPLTPESSALARAEFIVVAPQLPARGDNWQRYANEVAEIVVEVQRAHGADRARTFLTGFSFGGNGVFDVAQRSPELWAALWPVDPTRVPQEDPGKPVWLSAGEVSRYAGSTFTQRLRLEPLREGSEPGDRVYLDRGLDHVGTATAAYGDDRIYRWLLSRGRAGDD